MNKNVKVQINIQLLQLGMNHTIAKKRCQHVFWYKMVQKSVNLANCSVKGKSSKCEHAKMKRIDHILHAMCQARENNDMIIQCKVYSVCVKRIDTDILEGPKKNESAE